MEVVVKCDGMVVSFRDLKTILSKNDTELNKFLVDQGKSFNYLGWKYDIIKGKELKPKATKATKPKKPKNKNAGSGCRKMFFVGLVKTEHKPRVQTYKVFYEVAGTEYSITEISKYFKVSEPTFVRNIHGYKEFTVNKEHVKVIYKSILNYDYIIKFPNGTKSSCESINHTGVVSGIGRNTIKKRCKLNKYVWFDHGIQIKMVKKESPVLDHRSRCNGFVTLSEPIKIKKSIKNQGRYSKFKCTNKVLNPECKKGKYYLLQYNGKKYAYKDMAVILKMSAMNLRNITRGCKSITIDGCDIEIIEKENK